MPTSEVINGLASWFAWTGHIHLTTMEKEVSGYVASVFVLLTFSMSSMRKLRLTAMCSNICFIFYGSVAHVYPLLILHCVLLPVNITRLLQLRRARIEAQRLLVGAEPARERAALSNPRFLSSHVVADPGSALPLAEREQERVVGLLVAHLPSEAATASGIEPTEAAAAVPLLLGEIDRFLSAVSTSRPSAPELAWLAGVHSRNEVLRELQETLTGLAIATQPAPNAEAAEFAWMIAESLATILLFAEEASRLKGAADVDLLLTTTKDRSGMVERIRRKAIEDPPDGDPTLRLWTYSLTSLYERAVWLLHRYAALLRDRQDAFQSLEA